MRSFVDGHELQVVKTQDESGAKGLEAVCCVTCERHGLTSGFACAKIAEWNKNPRPAVPLSVAARVNVERKAENPQ